MEDYEIVEHRPKDIPNGNGSANGNGKMLLIKAINFKEPICIIFSSAIDLQNDVKVQSDGGKDVYYNGSVIGEIIAKQGPGDVTINMEYDIKYTGGYSKDGKIIYLDKDLPKTIQVEGKEVDLIRSIALHHELVEKWLIDDAYDYQYAHTIATKIERNYVESLGLKWESYDGEVGKQLRQIYGKNSREAQGILTCRHIWLQTTRRP
ncbi:MAG: hypothetical protein ACP5MK_03645 [Candidatus Micrarchaeia archaeon]